jgi:hypothetical protein
VPGSTFSKPPAAGWRENKEVEPSIKNGHPKVTVLSN